MRRVKISYLSLLSIFHLYFEASLTREGFGLGGELAHPQNYENFTFVQGKIGNAIQVLATK